MKKAEQKPIVKMDSIDSYISLALGIAVVLSLGIVTYRYFTRNRASESAQSNEATESAKTEESNKKTHTVKAGETLWSIAEVYYKSGYNWVDLQKANKIENPEKIEVGQTVVIPDVKPIISGQSTAAGAEKKTYTVVRGDSLWSIAVKQYNNGYRWSDIARVNKLANPGLIHAGNVLNLP